MTEANWMAGIEIPGIAVMGAELEIDLVKAMELGPEEFTETFLKALSEKTHEAVYQNAVLYRQETAEGIKVGIEFGFIADLDAYRMQLHEALLNAYREGMAAAVVKMAEKPEPAPELETVLLPEHPHSRACGITPHNHGLHCHENCPTCHGKIIYPLTNG